MKTIALILCMLALSGCSVMAVRKYDPYFKNTQDLSHVKGTFSSISVAGGSAPLANRLKRSSLDCRLTTYEMPAKTTVSDYIRDALNDEFDAAQKLSPSGKPIALTVNKLESDTSSFSTGTWTLDFDYAVAGQKRNIKTLTEFQSAYMGDTACRNTAEALQDALRANFAKFFKSL